MDELRKRYLLGDYRLEPDKQLLSRAELPVRLPKKPFQVLLYLIEHRDRYVSRAELLDAFWDGRDVYDDALRKAVGAIRKAFDEQPDAPRFVETRWGVGYRYVGPLEEQIVGEKAAVVEIEKTLGMRIVVEEEEIDDDEAEVVESRSSVPAPAPVLSRPAPKPRWKITALALTLLAAVTVAVALSSYRSRPAPTEGRREPIRSVAVLPLKNLTGDAADEYLSDGITESLIAALSKFNGLKVISRGSAFTYKGKDVDPRAAGRLLGAAAILEGSVRKSGDHVRVEVRLVRTSDGEVLWAGEAYDRPAADIFAVQDEVARNVAMGLRLKLSGEDGRRLAAHYTDNVEAYEAYLKGRYSLNKRTPEGITKGIEYFQQAITKDPNYALAYAAMAESYDKSYWFMVLPPQEAMAKEKEAAMRALVLDDSLAEAHVAMATVYANEWRLPEAAGEEERAIAINPGNAEAHHNYAYRLIDLLRPDEAVAEIKRARELDPLNVVMNIDVGEILLYARRYDEAIAALRGALEMDPGRRNAHWDLAQAYEMKGMDDEALAQFVETFTLEGASLKEAAALKKAYESGGIKAFWRERLEQLKTKPGYTEPVVIALIYTNLGDKDQAFAWLEKAYRERSPTLGGLKSSPLIDALRSDPRYEDLARRVGLS